MRKIIICSVLILLTGLISCDKSDDLEIIDNGYRVKLIEGNSKHWGDYRITFVYENNRMFSVTRTDVNENIERLDSIGYFSSSIEKNGGKRFLIIDGVTAIDADSVERLKMEFPTSYEDSLRNRRANITYYSNEYNGETKVETITKYVPRESFGTGREFIYRYLIATTQRNTIEYDPIGKPIIIRQFYDIYKKEDPLNSEYDREAYKYEIDYDGDLAIGVRYYIQDSYDVASWKMLDNYRITYVEGKLHSVTGDLYSRTVEGNTVKITEKGAITTYTLDSNGNAVRVDYPDGTYAKIEYEKGSGDYSEMIYSRIDNILGKNVIK